MCLGACFLFILQPREAGSRTLPITQRAGENTFKDTGAAAAADGEGWAPHHEMNLPDEHGALLFLARWLVGWVNCRRTDRRTKALIRNLRVAESSSVSSLRGTTGFLLVEFPQFNIDSNQRRKIHSRVVLSRTSFA